MRVEIELRYLPRFRIIDYLVQMGGTETEMLSVAGEGWTAYIEALEPAQVGIVQVPRDRLVIVGEENAVERVASFMQRKVRQLRHSKDG